MRVQKRRNQIEPDLCWTRHANFTSCVGKFQLRWLEREDVLSPTTIPLEHRRRQAFPDVMEQVLVSLHWSSDAIACDQGSIILWELSAWEHHICHKSMSYSNKLVSVRIIYTQVSDCTYDRNMTVFRGERSALEHRK